MKKEGVVFLIFGATGDLTKRKIIPGIYNLVNHNKIENFHILGVARKPLTAEKLIDSSESFIKKPKSEIIYKLKNNSSYIQLDFMDENAYSKLKESIQNLEKKGFNNRIFYYAVDSDKFEVISKNLARSGLAKNKKGFSRAVFEKPFGLSMESSRKLNKSIKKIFSENQIYRIDHYLGKELVGNISIVRFSNRILEPVWDNKNIENIQIILDEDFGIEERGAYYDRYGAIRDMVQNHMLQLTALVAMEMPKSFSGGSVRDKKAELLRRVKVKDVIIGQYDGYKKEKGIPDNSRTETFTALKLEIDNKRWTGVPFFLKTGKFLERKETKIVIKFRKVKCLFEEVCPTDTNYLEIRIYPDEGISLELNAKIPGKMQSTPINMNFCHSCTFSNIPEGYENLFADIINGDQSMFIREDELYNSWKIIDRIKKGKLHIYKKGSKGPEALKEFNKKHKIIWKQK
jgi:glucose-6-phosphate 1-dehydrogenase